MSFDRGDLEHPWSCLRQDVARYGGWTALFKEQSLWAVLWYRIGCRISLLSLPLARKPALTAWWFIFRFIELLTGVSLPLGAKIGGGLRIWHFGGIFVNSGSVIGKNCTLRQGVTIGARSDHGGLPIIGDDVELGAYAQVLGPVKVGNRATIGAMSVVIKDVPADHTAVGIPASTRAHKSRSAGSEND